MKMRHVSLIEIECKISRIAVFQLAYISGINYWPAICIHFENETLEYIFSQNYSLKA